MIKLIIQSLVTKSAVAVVNFLILIISSRYLGVSSRGDISLFILNISIVQIVCGIYTGYSIVHFVPKFNLKKILVSAVVFTLIFNTLSNTIIIFLNKQVEGYEWMGHLISFLVIINTFNCMVFLGQQNIKAFNLMSVVQPFLLFVGLLFFIFSVKLYTFEAYLYPLLISFSLSTVISTLLVLKKLKHDENKIYNLKSILLNGLAFQSGLLMYLFCNKFSYYVLSDKASLGLFSSATVIAESVLIVANAIAPVLLSKVANQTNNTKNIALSLSLSKLSFVVSLLGLLIILIVPNNFFVLILGKGFDGIKQVITLYSPGVLAMSALIPITNYLSASGKQGAILWAYFFGLLITLLMAPLIIARLGIYGAAITSNATYLTILLFMNYKLVKENNLSFEHYFSFRNDFKNLRKIIFGSAD